jgi:hypothetical protein
MAENGRGAQKVKQPQNRIGLPDSHLAIIFFQSRAFHDVDTKHGGGMRAGRILRT